jgi:rSAM/selenodomain-associated transferase 2
MGIRRRQPLAVTVELERFRSSLETAKISVIVPVLNEALIIEEALHRLTTMEGSFETIVVDNGSTDESVRLASRWARTITSQPGRGSALNAGARHAQGEVLLFLHADTCLPDGAFDAVEGALVDESLVGGCFSIAFDGDGWQPRLVGWLYHLFSRAGFFYGDAAIFVRRTTFEAIGGFKPLALMEDLDLCLRLRRRGRTVLLPQRVVSSGRRWREQGFLKTALVYVAIQGLYLLGIRSPTLFKLYKVVR